MNKRLGSQKPRYKVCPEYEFTYGNDCIELSSAYGLVPDEWQANFIRDMFAHDGTGRPVCATSGLDVPRQNGKNSILESQNCLQLAF